ncbi:MAG TPA: oligopeptide/dipeptide ABC transporter ATP-binding protein, partial [bacterium]|nr:oligopeptide/dipeptide ABC transporter ATP-binding protein [bacterium]
DPSRPPSGCYFHPRCPYAVDLCRTAAPPLVEIAPGRLARCHRATELNLAGVPTAPPSGGAGTPMLRR